MTRGIPLECGTCRHWRPEQGLVCAAWTALLGATVRSDGAGDRCGRHEPSGHIDARTYDRDLEPYRREWDALESEADDE